VALLKRALFALDYCFTSTKVQVLTLARLPDAPWLFSKGPLFALNGSVTFTLSPLVLSLLALLVQK
jgi:hypothetical protein